jgi:thiamine biosynthesis protein ThiS
MKVFVNGQERDVADGMTVEALVKELGIRREGTAIEVNREIVPKARYAQTVLKPNDRLEIVTFVGGG